MVLHRLLHGCAFSALIIGVAATSVAQVSIDDERTETVRTSTAGEGGTPDDVTITADGIITISSGTGLIVDSDNAGANQGRISADDADNVVGVELQGGASRSFINTGQIQLTESTTAEDTDNSGTLDGPFATGSGRIGILISGASPFEGNVQQTSTGSISIEGNDSFGIRLADTASVVGNIILDGTMSVTGSNIAGVSLEGDVIGNLANSTNINTRGENATAIQVSGDVDGQISNSGTISNTGYRFTQRPSLQGRNLIDDEDLLQAGAAIEVNGNVSNGIILRQILIETEDADTGEITVTQGERSSITQSGGAPAILIDGQGTPIAIGIVAEVTDPTDDDFDADLQYAFVNQGTLTAAGTYNDVGSAVFEVRDATLAGGINNTGTMNASTFRSGDDGTADVDGFDGHSRVIIIGDNAIAETINNSGVIFAQADAATDEIFISADNILSPRLIRATAIEVAELGSVTNVVNTGTISAVITARNGEAVAIRDGSGQLVSLENSGQILAVASNSDAEGTSETNFTLTALDLSANTSGVTVRQTALVDEDPDDDVVPASPQIFGDVLLGNGNDNVDIQSGSVSGDIDFAGGADTLSLSGGSSYRGTVTNSGDPLTLMVTGGSNFAQTSATPINVDTATFDGTSTFQPTIDGVSGTVSTLVATNSVTFGDGATVTPILSNVVGVENSVFELVNAGNLVLEGDLNTTATDSGPFLYDTSINVDPNNSNVLLVTLDLRSTDALGLDNVQAAAFTSAFEALGSNQSLANAVVNISNGTDFNNAYNQLLPEFAAAGRQFVLANVDGAVGAVGTHLDNARRSQVDARPGGAWIEEFAYFADRELAGLSEQYRGHGFGFTGGFDTSFGPLHTVGINFGFSSTEIEDVVGQDEPLDIVTLQAGLYGGYSTGNLGIEAYVGGGYNDFESTRIVSIGNFLSRAEGDWSGTHINGSLRAGYDLKISDRFWARPAVSVDYLSLKENGYTESGDVGVALEIDKRSVDVGSATAMMNFGATFQGRRTWIRPALRVGYRTEFIGDPVVTSGRFAGLSTPFMLTGEEFPDSGFLLGFTLAAGSNYSSFAFDFDSDIRDGFIRHTGRIVFRLLF